MKYYCGNKKPYVYVYFQREHEDEVIKVLEALNEQGVLFWRAEADNITKKELRRIEAAHSVLLFVVQGRRAPSCSHEMALDGRKDMEHEVRNVRVQNQAGVSLLDSEDTLDDANFRQVVDRAVEANKNILTIYQKSIPDMSDWAHLQLDSAQAMFRDSYEDENAFIEKLKEAAIFRNMEVTTQQKTFQRRTGITAILVPFIAIALVFGLVVYPLLIVPAMAEAEVSDDTGLKDLTQEELDAIEEFRVFGDTVISKEIDTVDTGYDEGKETYFANINYADGSWDNIEIKEHGNISDISDLKLLRNARWIEMPYQSITDISPLYGMDNIEGLKLGYNPINSIEGISQMSQLKVLCIPASNVTDISEVENLTELMDLGLADTPVSELPDLSKLKNLEILTVYNTLITDIPYLGEKEHFELQVCGLPDKLEDLSFARDVQCFDLLNIENLKNGNIIEELQGRTFIRLEIAGLNIQSISELGDIYFADDEESALNFCGDSNVENLEGIEKYSELRIVELQGCRHITDLTPLRNLPKLKRVKLSYELMNLAQEQLKGLPIQIDYI